MAFNCNFNSNVHYGIVTSILRGIRVTDRSEKLS